MSINKILIIEQTRALMDIFKKLSSGYYKLLRKCSSAGILVTTYIALIAITLATVWFAVTSAVTNYLNQQTDVLGSSLATQAAFNATQSILTNDLLSLNVLLNRLVVSDNILSARVYNKKDELLAEANRNGSQTTGDTELRPSDTHRVYSSPIRFRDEVVGHVLITLDKTSSQNTLSHISNLMVGIGIFLTAITALVIVLVVRRLQNSINLATDAIEAYNHGVNDAPLPQNTYREASDLIAQVQHLQTLELTAPTTRESDIELSIKDPKEEQFEINFDQIMAETERESCLLFIQLKHLEAWNEALPPLQVANLLTPIYRTIFLASEYYNGQVHQYESDSVIVLFQAKSCDDSLYMSAACCAELIKELLKELTDTELYDDVPEIRYHMGLHQGNEAVADMFEHNQLEAERVASLMSEAQTLAQSETDNQLVLSEHIITLPDIQNRIILSLPEIIEQDDIEVLAYTVKDLSDKYRARVQQQIDELVDNSEYEEQD